ncbi:ribonuclease MC-like [Papaver somniferum]|uniref:ribonuclease MC-like n=1 Tax=Papaver somniferum TaxID=3469 RepID=UPI000E700D0C|nr:ribonuclease MC-like [Papaver somniferum]
MTISVLYYVLVLSSSLLLEPSIEATNVSVLTQSFDYALALQWNPAVCNGNPGCSKKIFPRTLTVHGLWLQGQATRYCTTGPAYDPVFIIPIKNALTNIWINAESGTDEQFWRNEWWKHGRCSRFTQREYFQKVIDLVNYRDFRQQIVNSFSGGNVNRDLLLQTIRVLLGKNVQMICIRNQELLEIRFRYKYQAGTGFHGWTLEDSTWPQQCKPGFIHLRQR